MEKEELLFQSIVENFDAVLDSYLSTNNAFKIAVCDYLMGGNLFIVYGRVPKEFTYEEELKYDIENFNWDLKYPEIPSSCQLHLQALDLVKYLVQGYELTSNDDYLDLASKLIESWLDYEPTSKNRFTWYDHCVSDRLLVMIYFILTLRRNGISKYNWLIEKMNDSIKKHGEFFYNEDNYKPGNHGTMTDRSLYITSIYLNDPFSAKYREKAIYRLRNTLEKNFSDKMVCLENSIAYHLFNMELFIKIESLLNRFGDSLGKKVNQPSIESSVDFLIHCSKPDLGFPMMVDDSKAGFKSMKGYKLCNFIKDYPPLKWLLSNGNSGTEPEELFKIYPSEGYTFFRNSWDRSKINETTYASFRSGFSVKFHKHADDLSFTLFTKGKDIFVDSGTYTYEQGEFRRFFVHASAHNTVSVDNQSYDFVQGNSEDTGIIDHGENENYWYVVGKNDMYPGVNITRTLYFFKNGDIIIVDDIQSQDPHEYSQYYHLSSKININEVEVRLEGYDTLVKIYDDDVVVNMFQIGRCNVKFIKGDINKARPGIISKKFGHLEETTSFKVSKNSKNSRFITFITVDDVDKQNNKRCYINPSSSDQDSNQELIVKDANNKIKIPLKDYYRKTSQYLRVKQIDKTLFTFIITKPSDDESFAWYIFKNGEMIDKIWYDSNPVLNYLFTEPGNYQIRYFIKKGEYKKSYTSPIITITNEDIFQK